MPAKAEIRRRPHKKHRCADCFVCQWCSDDRCRLCRMNTPRARRVLELKITRRKK
ncbi:MAG: hypothetical protein ABSF80_04925 [Chitinispirillaceae bacterium]